MEILGRAYFSDSSLFRLATEIRDEDNLRTAPVRFIRSGFFKQNGMETDV